MSWAWLLLVWILVWVNDWPWLVGLTVLAGVGARHSQWPWLVVEFILVLWLEAVLAYWRPTGWRRGQGADLGFEGAALGLFTLLFGTLAGLVFWQVSLGLDARARLEAMPRLFRRLAWLRGIRAAGGLAVIILYSHGL